MAYTRILVNYWAHRWTFINTWYLHTWYLHKYMIPSPSLGHIDYRIKLKFTNFEGTSMAPWLYCITLKLSTNFLEVPRGTHSQELYLQKPLEILHPIYHCIMNPVSTFLCNIYGQMYTMETGRPKVYSLEFMRSSRVLAPTLRFSPGSALGLFIYK